MRKLTCGSHLCCVELTLKECFALASVVEGLLACEAWRFRQGAQKVGKAGEGRETARVFAAFAAQ